MTQEDDRERRIRERAYLIWLDQGRPHGRDREHWLEAEKQIAGEDKPAAAQDRQEGNGVPPPLPGPYENIS